MRAWIFSLVMVGCSEPATWYGAAGPIVEARCAGCHTDGGPAPMAFDSYEATARHAPVMAAAIRAGAMPPWQPAEGCNQYRGDLSLRPGERDLLLEYLDGDMPLGDPDAPPAIEVPVDPAPGVRPDVVLTLPEAYTPALQPDDYRCQIIPWPLAEPAYITGISVRPDRVQVVHHTIVFKAPADTLASWQALDDAEDGPGYTCFAGPGGAGFGSLTPDQLGQVSQAMQTGELPEGAGGTQWLGAWVPGASSNPFPEGSGLLIEPGDVVIVQMHYNTLASAPAPDQSSVVFEVASEVERRAWVAPFTDLGWVSGLPVLGEGPMVIPAGDPQVEHATVQPATSLLFAPARAALGVGAADPLWAHAAALHMHLLGTSGGVRLRRADGGEQCLLEIPTWDFGHQSAYGFAEPVRIGADDALELRCAWDNSAGNQPVIGGEAREPADVAWGEGSTDEMCLGVLYLTGG